MSHLQPYLTSLVVGLGIGVFCGLVSVRSGNMPRISSRRSAAHHAAFAETNMTDPVHARLTPLLLVAQIRAALALHCQTTVQI